MIWVVLLRLRLYERSNMRRERFEQLSGMEVDKALGIEHCICSVNVIDVQMFLPLTCCHPASRAGDAAP